MPQPRLSLKCRPVELALGSVAKAITKGNCCIIRFLAKLPCPSPSYRCTLSNQTAFDDLLIFWLQLIDYLTAS